jgi:hypothetical protein
MQYMNLEMSLGHWKGHVIAAVKRARLQSCKYDAGGNPGLSLRAAMPVGAGYWIGIF